MGVPEYPEQPNPETVARLRELLLETLRRQLSTGDALDAKAWQALGVGSIVLGLGVAGNLDGWWLVVPLIAYGILVVGVVMAVRVRGWRTLPEGDGLWRDAWYVSPEELEHTIVNALAAGEPENAEQLRTKAAGVRIALVGMVAEITALAIAAAAS